MLDNPQTCKVLAVDPSLTASGWALFLLADARLLAVGVLSPPGPQVILAKRLDELQRRVRECLAALELGSDDYLVCEGPAPLVRDPHGAIKVERVRSIFESVARERRIKVPGRLNPRTVQTELLGMKGKQLSRNAVKQWARETAMQLYGNVLEHAFCGDMSETRRSRAVSQDIIDALLIGTLAVAKLQLGLQSGLDLAAIFEPHIMRGKRKMRRGKGTVWTEAEFKQLIEK